MWGEFKKKIEKEFKEDIAFKKYDKKTRDDFYKENSYEQKEYEHVYNYMTKKAIKEKKLELRSKQKEDSDEEKPCRWDKIDDSDGKEEDDEEDGDDDEENDDEKEEDDDDYKEDEKKNKKESNKVNEIIDLTKSSDDNDDDSDYNDDDEKMKE